MQTLIPDIDENMPLPANAAEALPDLTPVEELNMRARTIKFISDLTSQPLIPSTEDKDTAIEMARQMMTDPKLRPEFAKYPNEMMAYLAGMVAQSNCMLVEELADFKLYVVNKLVYEIEHAPDSRTKLTAISKLGEIDGVDAFKRRSEVVVVVKPIEEVEKELLSVLEGIEYKVLGEEIAQINPSWPANTKISSA